MQRYLEDNTQAWLMDADGHYERAQPGKVAARSAQLELLQELSAGQPAEPECEPGAKLQAKRKTKAPA